MMCDSDWGSVGTVTDSLSGYQGVSLQGSRDDVATSMNLSSAVGANATAVRDVYVDYGGDAAARPADCASNIDGADLSEFSGECTIRSAFAYCLGLNRSVVAVCAVHLPAASEVEVDPAIGSIVVTANESSPSLVLYGDNAKIIQAKSEQWCRLFYFDGLSYIAPTDFFVEINEVFHVLDIRKVLLPRLHHMSTT